jgi:hypothetical protein
MNFLVTSRTSAAMVGERRTTWVSWGRSLKATSAGQLAKLDQKGNKPTFVNLVLSPIERRLARVFEHPRSVHHASRLHTSSSRHNRRRRNIVISLSVSCVINHPSALFVTCAGAHEKLCGASVIAGALIVYVGNDVIATSKLFVGGQGKEAVDEAGMVDGARVAHSKYAGKDPAGEEREARFLDPPVVVAELVGSEGGFDAS